jgi:hypothetical protein
MEVAKKGDPPSFEDAMLIDIIRSMRRDRQEKHLKDEKNKKHSEKKASKDLEEDEEIN